jgi:hypothetical protein
MTAAQLPVVRAWRPFVRRISMFKEALGSSDAAVLARRDALREELAGAPSLACDIVGVLITVVALVMMGTALKESVLPAFSAALAMASTAWLIPGHRWIFAPLRALAAGAILAVCDELRPGMVDDQFGAMFSSQLVPPPMDAFDYPIAMPLAILGVVLVALGLRALATRAPEPPVWCVAAAIISVVAVAATAMADYERAMDMRSDAHQAFVLKVVELRANPEPALSTVRAAIARRNISEEARQRMHDLKIAFPHDATVERLQRALYDAESAEQRASAATYERQQHRANATFDACVARCVMPIAECNRSGYRAEVCARTYKTIDECQTMCAN